MFKGSILVGCSTQNLIIVKMSYFNALISAILIYIKHLPKNGNLKRNRFITSTIIALGTVSNKC